MTEPTRKSTFLDELPRLVKEIEDILPDGDSDKIDEVLERLKNYNGLDDDQQKIVQNFKGALKLRSLLSPDDYLTDVKCMSIIDSGAFSDVYKGTWKRKEVAVKGFRHDPVEPPDHLELEASFKEELIQQVEPATLFYRELSCWKVISGFDFVWPLLGCTMWMDQDQPIVIFALVSPLAEGCLKLDYTDWKLLEPKQFASYFLDAAMGLQSLHKHGVVHGDIRSENILRKEGRCYLIDFGTATPLDDLRSFSFAPVTANAQRIPELLDGSVTRHDLHTDVFSFGSTMFQIFAREKLNIALEEPQRPENRLGQEWDVIWNLILSCVSEKRGSRPTASELVESLKTI